MVFYQTLDHYLATVQVSKEPIQRLRRYVSLKNLNENSNLEADNDRDSDADAMVTTIAPPELLFRPAKN